MSLLTEPSGNGLQGALEQGLRGISYEQSLTFSLYLRQTVAQDGYVFWVATNNSVTIPGSLHYGTEQVQDEDQTIGVNSVIFTATQEISEFNAVNSGQLWVADWQTPSGSTIQIAFSRRGPIYQQAGLFHYSGFAVYPALASQFIASRLDLPVGPIVSNSLPIWLAQNSFAPVYASFLVPENIVPPYIVAHIDPEFTTPLGAFPVYQWPGTSPSSNLYDLPSSQLMQDRVQLTLYGFTNQTAIQYLSSLMDYSLNTDDFGFCNSPAIRDEKRKQAEITAIAMKKSIEILASYYQGTADAVARRLILSAALLF